MFFTGHKSTDTSTTGTFVLFFTQRLRSYAINVAMAGSDIVAPVLFSVQGGLSTEHVKSELKRCELSSVHSTDHTAVAYSMSLDAQAQGQEMFFLLS